MFSGAYDGLVARDDGVLDGILAEVHKSQRGSERKGALFLRQQPSTVTHLYESMQQRECLHTTRSQSRHNRI